VVTAVTDCTKDIEVIFKMYLIQFINPIKSLVAIHAVMSQKFGFACNASGIRFGRGSGKWGKPVFVRSTSKQLVDPM